MEAIEQVPKTALDVFRMLPEGTLCEVIDNVLYMAEPRTYSQQNIVQKIGLTLLKHANKLKLGEVVFLPVDVYFEDLISAVQPDIMYVSNENMHILHDDGYFYGAPNLIIEILSTDKKRDKVYKKSLYERAGVKEYFIVNPINKNVLAYSLKNNIYELVYEEAGFFTSSILDFEFHF